MNEPNKPRDFSSLTTDEKIASLIKEREMHQYGDPGYLDVLNYELSMAFEDKAFEEEYLRENFLEEMHFAAIAPSKDTTSQEEEPKQEADPKPNETKDLESPAIPHHTARQIDDLHKAFLAPIKPKEQQEHDIVEQMIARKLAKGARKLRNGK